MKIQQNDLYEMRLNSKVPQGEKYVSENINDINDFHQLLEI